VHVDEARHEEQPARVDRARGTPVDAADRGDALARDRDVAAAFGCAGAVDDARTANAKVVCQGRALRGGRLVREASSVKCISLMRSIDPVHAGP